MDKSKLIWGIVCLALAGLLAVLNVRLPEDKLMFMVGGRNMPFIPPIVLGVVGVVLLATAAGGGRAAAQGSGPAPVPDEAKAALNKRLEAMGWGLFLIMLGGFMFVPGESVPRGVWSIGVGVIMLGLNVARYLNRIRMSGFTTALGIIAILGGVLQLLGMEALEGGILLIILGAYLILKPWFDRRQLFGKAEDS
jgi:hypothetical protein